VVVSAGNRRNPLHGKGLHVFVCSLERKRGDKVAIQPCDVKPYRIFFQQLLQSAAPDDTGANPQGRKTTRPSPREIDRRRVT